MALKYNGTKNNFNISKLTRAGQELKIYFDVCTRYMDDSEDKPLVHILEIAHLRGEVNKFNMH